MPLYEYKCKKCNEVNEVLVRGDETVKCPGCGSTRLEKLFSTFSAVTKSNLACPTPSKGCTDTGCASGRCPMMGN